MICARTRAGRAPGNQPSRIGDLKLFESAAIHLLVTDRDGWWAAMRICQLLQRRRSL